MATIIKRGKSWLARVRMRGVDEAKSFATKGQASAWATQLEADIISGAYHSGTNKTLIDAIERYKAEVTPKKKSASIETVMLDMLARLEFAELRLGEITAEMIANYRDAELQRVKPASVLRYINLLSVVFEQARREWKWVSVNPCKDIRKPGQGNPRDRIFTDDEVESILKNLGHNRCATDVQQCIGDCFLFAIETAMRAGEILALEWPMIDGRVATLPDTKNGDKRRVPLSTKAISVLDERRCHSKPFQIKPRTLAAMFTRYAREAGVYDASFHDTRHTAITKLARKLSPFELARIVGHRNLSQTLAYFNESAEQIADKLD